VGLGEAPQRNGPARATPRQAQGATHFIVGLRARLLAALVLTSAVTLAVAALALLPPLTSRLRADAINQTRATLLAAKPGFGSIPLRGDVPQPRPLRRQAQLLKTRGPSRVIIWNVAITTRLTDTDPDEPLVTARKVARRAVAANHHGNARVVDAISHSILIAASTYQPDALHRYVLEVFTKLNYVADSTNVVIRAFLEAAAAGLAAALLLGVALSSRLLRRLRLLRDATSGLDEGGLHELGHASARVHDEIGELARAFAQMRERLRGQESARRAFVATASHELRTPLTSLDGMLELLAEDLKSDPIDFVDARERVARAQQQTRRLASLASDLLDLSRLDAAVELRSEPVELGEIARAVSAEFELRADERGQSVVVAGAQDACWAAADPASVARIVRILLDNALRIAPAGSQVTISVAKAGARATIEVADQGPGVSPEERELIFERFQRGREHRGEAGFGLGLAIGRELARRMGGVLELVGGPPGAAFRLELDVAEIGVPVA